MNSNQIPPSQDEKAVRKLPETGEAAKKPLRRRPADKDREEIGFHNLCFLLIFPLIFFYLEIVLHISLFKQISGDFFVYSALYGISAGLITGISCSLFSRKVNYILSVTVLSLTTLYFGVQLVYCYFFKDFFYWNLLSVGGNLWQFWRETLGAIWANVFPIILLFIPLILFIIFGRKQLKTIPISWTLRCTGLVLAVVLFFGGNAFVNSHSDDVTGDKYVYGEGFQMSQAAATFGLFTALRLDTKYTLVGSDYTDVPELTVGSEVTTYDWGNLFGTTAPSETTKAPVITTVDITTADVSPVTGPETSETGGVTTDTPSTTEDVTTEAEVTTEAPKPLDTSPNVLDIDFDKLIASATTTAQKNAHIWFSTRTPTNKNEYTGLFKDKNIIWITVESWAPAAINQTLTPTLWKMKNEGFVFENYFCSNWGGSTATGEYAVVTGNFYNSATCLKDSAKTLEKFTLGNMLGLSGYKCMAFHNWTYTYYGRDKSHPNFGYDWHGTEYVSSGKYPGTNGWDAQFTRAWPTSDAELGTYTTSYIPTDGSKFHLYYMTVSGHPYQTWDNSQARKHKAEILAAGLSYTDEYALSYIACQYEVELLVSTLVNDLTEKGLLEDTVFVMAPDHYPYDITGDDEKNKVTLSQLYGLSPDGIFTNYNLYRAPLVIWSASMKEPVRVTKVCSAIDVLPTVLNLFGCEYDSRLIMGHDILSDSEGFVILNMSNGSGAVGTSYNWMTDYGFFNNSTKNFEPFEGVTVDTAALKASGYLSVHSSLVNSMYTYSKYILEKDYYKMLFPNG